MHFMFLVELSFRSAFQLSLAVLVHYRLPTEYLALDRQHDPYSTSTIKLAYSQSTEVLVSRNARRRGDPDACNARRGRRFSGTHHGKIRPEETSPPGSVYKDHVVM